MITEVLLPETLTQAAQNMLATLHQERAKYEVQRVTNGHTLDDICAPGSTYRAKRQQLMEAEGRLRDEYGDLL